MVDEVLMRPGVEGFTISAPDLQQVIQELDSAIDKALKIMDGGNQTANGSSPGVSFSPDPMSSKNIVVGLDEDLFKLKDRLSGQQSKLEVIPIVGMGGIGETTLAQTLYNDPLIVSHFDIRAWITISQDYNLRAILLGLLGCIIGKLSDEILQEKNNQLGVILHKRLYGRRYLIVLDDIWNIKALDDIKLFFPNESNRSRIVLTTRESNVAEHADSRRFHHQMHLLNKSQSWNLLHQKVFGNEDCPDALERLGRRIAGDCGGLPLAIHVMGGLLSEAKRTEDFWEHVANNVRAAIGGKDERISKILSLSYDHLPVHLKPCFLYMGAFSKDHEIRASRLIRLWVAEGFLNSNGDKSLEEEAEDCLKALVDRNIILVRQWKTNEKAKIYIMHDLMRDLCVRKASEEKFLFVKNGKVHNTPADSFCSLRRVSVHPSYRIRDMYASIESMSLARTFLCNDLASRVILSPVFFDLRLLRILDVYNIEFQQFPTEILLLVCLRYLALNCNADLPCAISRLWNLQTLIVRSNLFHTDIPSELWEMSDLRHLKFKNTIIWIESHYKKTFVQEKLQTISHANLFELIESGFLESIPNIKNLGISCEISPPSIVDLSHLHKLETLKCSSNLWLEARTLLSTLRFPPSVRKLILSKCGIPLGFMETLSELPNLEVLKIRNCVFERWEVEAKDEEWEASEREEFCSLKLLLLEDLKLARWRADETNFPRLRHLIIWDCSSLEEIPCGIGEIPTLEVIALDESSPSAVASARQIQEKQHESENYDLQLRIFKN